MIEPITCPHCGYEDDDYSDHGIDIGSADGSTRYITTHCLQCDAQFVIEASVMAYFQTFKAMPSSIASLLNGTNP